MKVNFPRRSSRKRSGGRLTSLWHSLVLGLTATRLLMLEAQAAGHVHVQIEYVENQWTLFVYDFAVGRLPAATTPLPVSFELRSEVPDDPRYTTFLGPAGGPVWILPQSARPNEISMGVGTSRIAPNVFSRNEVYLSLHRVEGPGQFAMYNANSQGAPELIMATFDGVDPAADRLSVPALGGHLHMNWAFTAPGTYRLGFAASGVLRASGQRSESPVVDFTFVVEPAMLRLLGPRPLGDGSFVCTLESDPQTVCTLEHSSNLQTWTSFLTVTNQSRSMEVTLPVSETESVRFLRAVMGQ